VEVGLLLLTASLANSLAQDRIGQYERLRELAAQRRRFGYRRLHILLTREGLVMNHKKLRRL
jgi:transposase InsO family protein